VTTCLCTDPLERHDMARARWQPCSRPGCGCVLFRPRPVPSFTQMELYPLDETLLPSEIAARGETA